MLYQVSLTIPENTFVAAIESVDLLLLRGTINLVQVDFPPGCCGLVYARVMHKEHQLFPTTPGQWFRQDNFVFEWAENLEISENPFIIRLEGYNLDQKYSHEVTLRVAMFSELARESRFLAGYFAPYLME